MSRMKYANQYIKSAAAIIDQYDGAIPLAAFLKNHFSQNKKYGSKDRRHISHLCYCYYRSGHALKSLPVEQSIRVALFLCQHEPGEWAALFEQDWLDQWTPVLQRRVDFIKTIEPTFATTAIFPRADELSSGIDATAFAVSHLIQPDLFLRIRPGQEVSVIKKLTTASIPFQQLSATCLALPNTSKIDAVIVIDKEAVIQDYSSQRIADFLQLTMHHVPAQSTGSPLTIWDCCAASGGKSILAKDVLKNISLTVSDIRPSILRNLAQRFEKAGVKNYHSFVADLTNPQSTIRNLSSKLIICDAPCSGSGTWGRTPEQLYYFIQDRITAYAALQKKIVGNILLHLSAGSYLLYITCSVFKKENEEVAAWIAADPSIKLVKMELLKGYDKKADSMFAALFIKSVSPAE